MFLSLASYCRIYYYFFWHSDPFGSAWGGVRSFVYFSPTWVSERLRDGKGGKARWVTVQHSEPRPNSKIRDNDNRSSFVIFN